MNSRLAATLFSLRQWISILNYWKNTVPNFKKNQIIFTVSAVQYTVRRFIFCRAYITITFWNILVNWIIELDGFQQFTAININTDITSPLTIFLFQWDLWQVENVQKYTTNSTNSLSVNNMVQSTVLWDSVIHMNTRFSQPCTLIMSYVIRKEEKIEMEETEKKVAMN